MPKNQNLTFGPDKSQILRGLAIIFMVAHHNDTSLPGFRICVPMFTFLVGVGYFYAKNKNIRHGLKRIWHLLSHFWLILLGIIFPIAVIAGGYKPTIGNLVFNMFGMEENLNWFSWYVNFYIFAMFLMIPVSRIIRKYKLSAAISLCLLCYLGVGLIHLISGWHDNIWILTIHNCIVTSPPMFIGYYCAQSSIISRFDYLNPKTTLGISICAMVITYFVRYIPYAVYLDFISVPIFCLSIVLLFNYIATLPKWGGVSLIFIQFGKESMNIWFLHSLFFTTCTASVLYPLFGWLDNFALRVVLMFMATFFLSRLVTAIYSKLTTTKY